MHVRSAGVDDVDALARLRAEWRGQPVTADYADAFREWFLREQSSRWWWIAEVDDIAVGMVNVKLFDRMPSPGRAPSRWGYVANLFVVPAHRGHGVAGSLISCVTRRARDEGLVRLVLSPSEQAVPLYGRHGFRAADDLLLLPLDTEGPGAVQ